MTSASTPTSRAIAASTLSKRIRLGVFAGAATGLLFGDYAAVFRIPADGYVRLLQMTVLPYVTISIVARLGRRFRPGARGRQTRRRRAGAARTAGLAAALSCAVFPPHGVPLSAPRCSTSDFGLYIPTNPFNSLANNIVPAVVLFSLFLGLALIPVPKKKRLIRVLAVGSAAIANATNFVVSLTPYGVFAISAVVAGTLDFETLSRLQVYLISYVGVALLLALWVLPGIVAALTPIPFGAIMRQTRDALILAFMTTSLFAVLPMLIEEAKELLREYVPADEARTAARRDRAGVVQLPHAGKLPSPLRAVRGVVLRHDEPAGGCSRWEPDCW